MAKNPFSGPVAASSAVDRKVGTHNASRCRLPTRNREMLWREGSAREGTSGWRRIKDIGVVLLRSTQR
jgi:hypothetical protein